MVKKKEKKPTMPPVESPLKEENKGINKEVGKEDAFDMRGNSTLGTERLLKIVEAKGWSDKIVVASLLDRAPTFAMKKIPTGIFMLDWLTHGGIPMDRITRIWGKQNSAKTTTMLKLLANMQKHCRYCFSPIVEHPTTKEKDCSCPKPRYKITKNDELNILSQEEAKLVLSGVIPSTFITTAKGVVYKEVGNKKIFLEQTYRCEPMQCLYVETEHKLDEEWARKVGVNTSLVVILASAWAEDTINKIAELLYSKQIDALFIDTITQLTSRDTIEKSMEENTKVANHAVLIQRLLGKIIAAQYDNGIYNDRPITVVMASQVRTQGIGNRMGGTFLGPSEGNAANHDIALDIELNNEGYVFKDREHAQFGNFSFIIHKNHTGGSSGVSGVFNMWLDPNSSMPPGYTDDIDHIINYGTQLQLINNYSFETRYGKQTCANKKDLMGFLLKNPTICAELRKTLIEKIIHTRTKLEQKLEAKNQKKLLFTKHAANARITNDAPVEVIPEETIEVVQPTFDAE